ncbi:MAG: HNH endonuclease [Chloroflexales bacterium]|nr:HNH endonuclease [Chloroflexales bacterium]
MPGHVPPIARGGTNDTDNIQPLCAICNKRKNTRMID